MTVLLKQCCCKTNITTFCCNIVYIIVVYSKLNLYGRAPNVPRVPSATRPFNINIDFSLYIYYIQSTEKLISSIELGPSVSTKNIMGLNKLIENDLRNHNLIFQEHTTSTSITCLLVSDFIFNQFVISPIFVITWSGTWQNADTFFDKIIFRGNVTLSALFCLVVGIIIAISILLFQQTITNVIKSGKKR